MTSYYAIGENDALRYLEARDAAIPVPLEDVRHVAGDGPIIDTRLINCLYDEIKRLQQDFPSELGQRDKEGGRFERAACEIVHRKLSGLPQVVLADPDFWTWLSVARFGDIIEWRFGIRTRPAKFENYGVGKRSENLLFRLWLRGEIGYVSDADDPYELARTGDQDLWRSHIMRQNYANARQIARALLRLQANKLEHARLSNRGIRALAKLLKRVHANVLFEVLADSQANGLVLELCDDPRVSRFELGRVELQ